MCEDKRVMLNGECETLTYYQCYSGCSVPVMLLPWCDIAVLDIHMSAIQYRQPKPLCYTVSTTVNSVMQAGVLYLATHSVFNANIYLS